MENVNCPVCKDPAGFDPSTGEVSCSRCGTVTQENLNDKKASFQAGRQAGRWLVNAWTARLKADSRVEFLESRLHEIAKLLQTPDRDPTQDATLWAIINAIAGGNIYNDVIVIGEDESPDWIITGYRGAFDKESE